MDVQEILSRVANNEATLADYNNLKKLLINRGQKVAITKASYALLTNPALSRQILLPKVRIRLAAELTKDLK